MVVFSKGFFWGGEGGPEMNMHVWKTKEYKLLQSASKEHWGVSFWQSLA